MIGCDSDDCEREWVRSSCALDPAFCRLTELSRPFISRFPFAVPSRVPAAFFAARGNVVLPDLSKGKGRGGGGKEDQGSLGGRTRTEEEVMTERWCWVVVRRSVKACSVLSLRSFFRISSSDKTAASDFGSDYPRVRGGS
jgi:hypothetical protein